MTTLLDEALEAWTDARNGVIAELENIPANQFDDAAGEGARSVGELALHIAEVGLMMVGELTRDDGDFRRAAYDKLIAEYRGPIDEAKGKDEIIAAMKRTLEDGVRAFREAGELHMFGKIRRFDGQYGSRFAWMQHGVGHEEYHRGQIAMSARLMGIKPALTKLIEGG
ncbi:MAG TPA: DinB family protein [Thermoanaerobaculia bacterium]|nr:DinB family protein [Thermoanaerobaculia bacterium]